MSRLSFSKDESERIGLRIGRSGRQSDLHPKSLTEEIIKNKLDVVKIKVPLESDEVFSKLDELPYFWEPLNLITHQQHLIIDGSRPIDPSLTFELYNGENPAELLQIVKRISGEDTNLYYQSGLHELFFPDRVFWSSAHEYYLAMINNENPERFLFIGRDKEGAPMGICSFQKIAGNQAEGVIYGVLPEHRGKNLAMSFLNKSINTLYKEGVSRFNTEVQYFNFRSLYPHIQMGFKPVGMYMNVEVFPMLAYAKTEDVEIRGNLLQSIEDLLWRSYQQEYGIDPKLKLKKVRGDLEIMGQTDSVDLIVVRKDKHVAMIVMEADGKRLSALYSFT